MNKEKLLQFPCEFPIKIMGINDSNLLSEITEIVSKYYPQLNPKKDISTKHSSKGNYISITLTIFATSQKQLDDIYKSLNQHKLIKLTL